MAELDRWLDGASRVTFVASSGTRLADTWMEWGGQFQKPQAAIKRLALIDGAMERVRPALMTVAAASLGSYHRNRADMVCAAGHLWHGAKVPGRRRTGSASGAGKASLRV